MDLDNVVVHSRVMRHHPEVSEADVIAAWSNRVGWSYRPGTNPLRYLAIGYDDSDRLLEMCAVFDVDHWVIFHAMPATAKFLREVTE